MTITHMYAAKIKSMLLGIKLLYILYFNAMDFKLARSAILRVVLVSRKQ